MSRFLRGGDDDFVKYRNIYFRLDDEEEEILGVADKATAEAAGVTDVDAKIADGSLDLSVSNIGQIQLLADMDKYIEDPQNGVAGATAQPAKVAAAYSTTNNVGNKSNKGILEFKNGVLKSVPEFETPKDGRSNWSELFPALSMQTKMRYVGKDGKTVKNILDHDVPKYMGTGTFQQQSPDLGACGIPKGSRTWRLRQQLMTQLKGLAKSEGAADGLCFGSCKEDEHLEKMEATYRKHFKGDCGLSSFKNDDRLKMLEAKKQMLHRQSFAFLHSECEGDDECNPFGKDDIMPEPLLDCCGVREGALLFGDESMAAVGKFLSGSQKAGESPAALGHASNLYQTGLIAPGVDKSKLWINICYLVGKPMQDLSEAQKKGVDSKRLASSDNAYLDTKWVPANVLEQKKYMTLKGIERAITERKRAILKVNRQILELQMQMANVQGSDNYFSGDEDSGSDSSFVNTQKGIEMYVQNSVNRAKSVLLGAAAKRHLREADQKFNMRVAHGKKGVARETEKALAKLIGGKKKKTHKRKRHRSSRRRR